MTTGKKAQKKAKPLTLKAVQNCVDLTLDGRRRLDLSFKGIAAVPKCVNKLFDINELDLSRNLLRKVPGFIENFTKITVLDLHSNYVSMTGRGRNSCSSF